MSLNWLYKAQQEYLNIITMCENCFSLSQHHKD